MKKKLIIGIAILTMAISFVGCSTASVSTKPTDNQGYVIEYSVAKPTQDAEHYLEMLIYGVSANSDNYVIADDIQEKIDYIQIKNEEISMDFMFDSIEPTRIEITGEIKDGKTYFYYNGYMTTLDGERMDYNKEIVCDFTLEPEIFNFDLDV